MAENTSLTTRADNEILAERDEHTGKIMQYMQLCPTITDPVTMLELIAKAQHTYMSGGAGGAMGLHNIHPEIPLDVCEKMIRNFGWRTKRVEALQEQQVAAATSQVAFINNVRVAEATRIVNSIGPVIERLAAEINAALDGDGEYRTSDARRLSEALSQLTGSLMTAAGIDGKVPEMPEGVAAASGENKKQPWVSIHATGPVRIASGETLENQ